METQIHSTQVENNPQQSITQLQTIQQPQQQYIYLPNLLTPLKHSVRLRMTLTLKLTIPLIFTIK